MREPFWLLISVKNPKLLINSSLGFLLAPSANIFLEVKNIGYFSTWLFECLSKDFRWVLRKCEAKPNVELVLLLLKSNGHR
jgi:hypothetical protein